MSYEIPQQLNHKEKILFGLTLSQIAWASFFLTILLIIFKLPIPTFTKFFLALFPSTIGILFMFFDFGTWIKRIMSFSKLRTISANNPTMKALIPIKK